MISCFKLHSKIGRILPQASGESSRVVQTPPSIIKTTVMGPTLDNLKLLTQTVSRSGEVLAPWWTMYQRGSASSKNRCNRSKHGFKACNSSSLLRTILLKQPYFLPETLKIPHRHEVAPKTIRSAPKKPLVPKAVLTKEPGRLVQTRVTQPCESRKTTLTKPQHLRPKKASTPPPTKHQAALVANSLSTAELPQT